MKTRSTKRKAKVTKRSAPRKPVKRTRSQAKPRKTKRRAAAAARRGKPRATKGAARPKTKRAARPKTKRAARPKTKRAARPKTKRAARPKTKRAATPKTKRAVTKTVRKEPPVVAARMLRRPRAFGLCIPIAVPIQRAAPLPPPVVERPAPPPPQPPPAIPTPPAPTRLIGVRVGRLPPRDDAPSSRPSVAPPSNDDRPLRVTPTRPRTAVTPDTWKRVDAAAARLGIEALRSEQRRAMRAVLEGRDALVALPSGSGKSVCYLAPALILDQPALVISGRARLLRGQYDRLLQRRLPVAWLDATNGRERSQALAQIAAGGPLVVFAPPESLADEDALAALAGSGLSFVAVDDGHAASEWSDEYRPGCATLAATLGRLGGPPTVALLGAATAATRHDVVRALGLRDPVLIEGPALRENLELDAVECRGEVRQRMLVELVMRLRRPGIIHCSTPREVDAVYGALAALRVPVHRFHGLLPPGERLGEQLNFLLPGRRAVMVATSGWAPTVALAGMGEARELDRAPDGFGAGLDKRDIRFVIHYGAPASLEQYAREIGAAGRDGESATCVLLHAPEDRGRCASLLAELRPVAAHVMALARALEPYAIERRPATLEALALSAGLSRRAAEVVARVLVDAGAIAEAGGWLRVRVSLPMLFERVRRLASSLETLRRQDEHRLAQVSAYASSGGCRSAFLARHFDVAACAGACACAVCNPARHPVASAPLAEVPRRRPPAEEFGISRVAQPAARRTWVERSEPRGLTAKLGDFGSLAAKFR